MALKAARHYIEATGGYGHRAYRMVKDAIGFEEQADRESRAEQAAETKEWSYQDVLDREG